MRRAASVLLVGAALLTLARGYRSPLTYATGSWLLDYDRGFVPRGLSGALVQPLLAFKSAAEVTAIIQTLSLVVLLGLVLQLCAASGRMLRSRTPFVLARFVMVTSAWTVFAGHTAGFLDHNIELLTLVGLLSLGTRWRWILAPLGVAAVLMHEAFLVLGLPIIAFGVLLHAWDRSRTRALRELLVLVGPALLAAAGVGLATRHLSGPAIDALGADVARYGVLGASASDNAVYYLRHGLAAAMAAQRTGLWARLGRADIAAVVVPPLALFLGLAGAWLWGLRRRAFVPLLVAVVLAPLSLHLVAWDTERFSIMTLFPAYGALVVLSRWRPAPAPGAQGWWWSVLALAVLALNLVQRVPLMAGERDGDALLGHRTAPDGHSFEGCAPVFANSGFEEGTLAPWSAAGTAFDAPIHQAIGRFGARLVPGTVGGRWLGTYAAGESPAPRDAATGQLDSPLFPIRADTLLVAVGGGQDPARLRVSLLVDEEEVAWETGRDRDKLVAHAWDVSAWRGPQARVRVLDDSTGPWGHVNVDGLCWYRP